MTEPSGTPPLLVEGRLDHVPGGPYNPEAVAIAESTIRGVCGWHIAPSITEAVLRDGDGSRELLLPTLHLTDVVEVRTGDIPMPLSEYEWSQAGLLTRWQRWPARRRSVMVVMTHGYPEAPPELAGLVAELAAAFRATEPGVRSMVRTVGGVTINRAFTDSSPARGVLDSFSHVIDRYRVQVPTW